MTEFSRFTFRYTIKEEDYARAQRAHARTFKWLWALWIVFGAIAAYSLLVGIFNVGQGDKTPLSLGKDALVFAVGGVLMWGIYWLPPLWAMRGSPSVGVEEEISLFDDRIVIQSRLGREELLWAHFRKVDEIAEFFLLHPHEGNVYPVPKQYFANSGELDWFRQHILNFNEY